MSTKREYAQPLPSVMARLMGLDEIPIQRPAQKKPRVLSENYLHRVSSIGVRKKCSDQKSLKSGTGQHVEHKNVLQVIETLRKKKHLDSSDVLQSGHLAMSISSRRDINKGRTFTMKSHLNSPKRIRNDVGVYSSGACYLDDLIPNSRIVVRKPNLEKNNAILIATNRNLLAEKKERIRLPNDSEFVRPRFRKERNKMVGQSITTVSSVEPMLSFTSSDKKKHTREFKKQVTERGKATKRFKRIEIAGRSESRCRSQFAFFNSVESPNSKLRQKSIESVGYMSEYEAVDLMQNGFKEKGFNLEAKEDDLFDAEPQAVKTKFPSNFEKQQSESCNSIMSEKEHSSLCLGDALHIQDISYEIFDEESVSSNDPESLISFEEAYQPSPNSVLDRLGNKQTISDCFKTSNASLHGLHLQLELLKSKAYSEGSSMVVSSDDDSEKESINEFKKNNCLFAFKVEESRDFSYLVDVLMEAGLQSGKFDNKYSLSNSAFETLEKKKYREQISWSRSERRLLFDRVNSGLADISQPLKGTMTLTKSVAKRFRFGYGDDMVEELWGLLVEQEEELSKESEKILGKDDRWMELGDEIQVIGREIEDYLIDELVHMRNIQPPELP